MDLRCLLAGFGLPLALLLAACSPDATPPHASLEERTAQFEKALETLQDPPLKEAAAELGSSLLLLERARQRLEEKPLETEYGNDALALLKHYPSPQALADAYVNGLFVLHRDASSDYLVDLQPVFPFSFDYPDTFPFPHALEWQSVTLDNRQVIPFQVEWSETDPGIQLSPSSANMTHPDDLTLAYPFTEGLKVDKKQQPRPVTLQGRIELIAPARMVGFELRQGDIGKRQSRDGISLTLLSLDRNSAEVELHSLPAQVTQIPGPPLNPLIIQARDPSGQFLSRSGTLNESPRQVAFYQQQLAQMLKQPRWSEAFEKQLEDQQKAFEAQQPRQYTRAYFNGSIERLEIQVMDFSTATPTRKALDLPVRRFDSGTAKAIEALPMPVVVYDDHAAGYLEGARLDAERLKSSVVISQSVEDASAARIEFSHPATFNDELLGSERTPGVSPLTFFAEDEQGQRGEPLELPKEAFLVDPMDASITYDLNLFPQTPAYAVGSMPLFLADIQKSTLAIHALPKGLELRDNALVVDQQLFPADTWRFYAKDATGQYLKEILATRHSDTPDSPPRFDVHYFYGQPSQLESYQRTELNTVEYGFEVKLDKGASGAPGQ